MDTYIHIYIPTYTHAFKPKKGSNHQTGHAQQTTWKPKKGRTQQTTSKPETRELTWEGGLVIEELTWEEGIVIMELTWNQSLIIDELTWEEGPSQGPGALPRCRPKIAKVEAQNCQNRGPSLAQIQAPNGRSGDPEAQSLAQLQAQICQSKDPERCPDSGPKWPK